MVIKLIFIAIYGLLEIATEIGLFDPLIHEEQFLSIQLRLPLKILA